MSWVAIDDRFPRHPKGLRVGRLGRALFLDCLCYANEMQTDGFVPKTQMQTFLREIATELGVKRMRGQGSATVHEILNRLLHPGPHPHKPSPFLYEFDAGYQIHDYLDYQLSREEIRARRKKIRRDKQVAGRRGGASRAKTAKRDGTGRFMRALEDVSKKPILRLEDSKKRSLE